MSNILLWIGIGLILIGWLTLAWQASKWVAWKNELDRFPQKKKELMLRRAYCWLTIIGGIILIMISIMIK